MIFVLPRRPVSGEKMFTLKETEMKKLLMIFALCALCGSAFAAVTLTDWKVGYIGKDEFSKEPLMRDLK